MKEYLKMADVFVGEYNPAIRIDQFPAHRHGEQQVELYGVPANYAAHAINSHDELVENVLHYKQDAEQWEARATKEASRAQDLEAEVDRLCEIIMLAIEVNESMASAVPATDWGSGFKECATSTSKALMETANKHSPKWVAYQMAKLDK